MAAVVLLVKVYNFGLRLFVLDEGLLLLFHWFLALHTTGGTHTLDNAHLL